MVRPLVAHVSDDADAGCATTANIAAVTNRCFIRTNNGVAVTEFRSCFRPTPSSPRVESVRTLPDGRRSEPGRSLLHRQVRGEVRGQAPPRARRAADR